jgi:hypothetical protein
MKCTNCGSENDDQYRFCMKCGSKLDPTATLRSAAFQPAVQFAPRSAQTYQPPGQLERGYSYPAQPHSQREPFGMPKLSSLNIWGPFVGYGTRRSHTGWLMDGQGSRANDLVLGVASKFNERQIPYAEISQEILTARGLLVENRPYFILRRGLASLALYISQFGRDLFISLASYLKPPISNFRVVVVAIMIVFQVYMTFIYPYSLSNSLDRAASGFGLFGSPSLNIGGLIILLCILGPLGAINSIALFLLFCFSTYKWLTERDFAAPLRVTPNEFNEDDLMAMAKAVEQTVRISLDEIGLNPDDLKPASDFGNRRII